MNIHVLRNHREVDTKMAMARIIFGPDASNTKGKKEGGVIHKAILTCYMCGFSTVLKANIQTHVRRNHEGVGNIGKIVDRVINGHNLGEMEIEELTNHETPEKADFFCYICSFSTALKHNMYSYIIRRHKDANRKEVMDRITKSPALDKMEMEEGNNNRPQKSDFVCSICGFYTALGSTCNIIPGTITEPNKTKWLLTTNLRYLTS